MPVDCQRSTSGGKGNLGMFIERDAAICAAGLPSRQPDLSVKEVFDQYLLKDHVDALISDAIFPPPKPRPPPPLRKPRPPDVRFVGLNTQVAGLINPAPKSKFQTLIDEIKDTSYASTWKNPLGEMTDITPVLPAGFDIKGTTFGKRSVAHESLYDIIMPANPSPDQTPHKNSPGYQVNRNYKDPFNRDLIYGYRTRTYPKGNLEGILTDEAIITGKSARAIEKSYADHLKRTVPLVGTVLAPDNNIQQVPEGYSFGKLEPPHNITECFATSEMNPKRIQFLNCLRHINSLRKSLSYMFLPTFFRKAWLDLKYLDKDKCGWLPKETVYKYLNARNIRFDRSLVEPLLEMWHAFDGTNIEYKIFCDVLNFKLPTPDLPKVSDYKKECLDFSTTYREMTKPGQVEEHEKMAGAPTGPYFSKDYPIIPPGHSIVDEIHLMDEGDVRSRLIPSVMSIYNISHRDMFCARGPDVVRRVFEASGASFTDESFSALWEEAKKYHSQGLVCYETFRKVLESKLTTNKK